MASFTIIVAPWPVGTAVNVYVAEAWVQPTSPPAAAPLATGTVTSQNTVSFSGLPDNRRLVAYALGIGVQFSTSASSLAVPVAIPDRQRITALEDAVSAGAGSTWLWDGTTYVPASSREFKGPVDPSTAPGITLTEFDTWTPTATP